MWPTVRIDWEPDKKDIREASDPVRYDEPPIRFAGKVKLGAAKFAIPALWAN